MPVMVFADTSAVTNASSGAYTVPSNMIEAVIGKRHDRRDGNFQLHMKADEVA